MDLFTPTRLGRLELPNRIVMAPMTRSRAIGNVPNALVRDYYVQRASAGLIITEGTAPSPNALGYSRIPGLFSAAQVAGWRQVTDGVHAAGGRIVAQLMHTGRVGHALNLPAGARVLGPSAIAINGSMWTDQQQMQPLPTPEAMSGADISEAIGELATAASNAIAAGFDGIELHGANGYLIEQFLSPSANQRDDAYGGDVERRARFVREVVAATAEAIGADRVGIRLSPHNTLQDLAAHPEVHAQYEALAPALRGLAYVHLVELPGPAAAATRAMIREVAGAPIIVNAGYDAARANAVIGEGKADAVSFGRPFVANPDLVARFRDGRELAKPNAAQFFSPGPEGYVDYPAL